MPKTSGTNFILRQQYQHINFNLILHHIENLSYSLNPNGNHICHLIQQSVT
jgi:hypothetical protein